MILPEISTKVKNCTPPTILVADLDNLESGRIVYKYSYVRQFRFSLCLDEQQ